MLRSKDYYEPEVWEMEEETEFEEELTENFNNVLNSIYYAFRKSEPDYRNIRGQKIC